MRLDYGPAQPDPPPLHKAGHPLRTCHTGGSASGSRLSWGSTTSELSLPEASGGTSKKSAGCCRPAWSSAMGRGLILL